MSVSNKIQRLTYKPRNTAQWGQPHPLVNVMRTTTNHWRKFLFDSNQMSFFYILLETALYFVVVKSKELILGINVQAKDSLMFAEWPFLWLLVQITDQAEGIKMFTGGLEK